MSYHLSMVEAKLPPGFRFHPRDDELICDYLTPKVAISGDANAKSSNSCSGFPMLINVDLNKCEPWDLPDMACVGRKEWYFFNLRDRKYATGQRTNRATLSGYWKATGKDRQVVRRGNLVGMRKTLVFYQGRAPKGKKTDWVMHEFRLEGRVDHTNPTLYSCKQEDWVLCRVLYKSRGIGTSSKPLLSKENCYEDTSSPSLPVLTDTFLGFDQTFPLSPQTAGNFTSAAAALEQVPCFSNYPQMRTTTQQCMLPKGLASSGFNPVIFSLPVCDENVLRSVLDHFSKLEGKPPEEISPTLAQTQTSSESYLTEAAVSSSMWYPFQS